MGHRQYFKVIDPLVQYPPATYCVANDYVPDTGLPYEPPIDIGTPNSEEIILLCDNSLTGVITVICSTSSGTYYAEVYDSANSLIETTAAKNSNVVLQINLPQTAPGYYKIIYKLTTGGTQFRIFKVSAASGWVVDWQILQAKFNTPNLTSLVNAFEKIKTIKSVVFDCTLNSLSSMASMFVSSGIENFTFPASLPALTTVAAMFQYSDITKITSMAACLMPELTTMLNFCNNTVRLQKLILPDSLPKVTTLQSMCNISNLSDLTLPTQAMPALTTIGYMCQNSKFLKGEVIIPEATALTTIQYAFDGCDKVEIVRMSGTCNLVTTLHTSFVNNCYALRIFEFARTMNGITSIQHFWACTSLEDIIFPDSMQSASLGSPASTFASNTQRLKSVTGDALNATTNFNIQYQKSSTLEVFDCPNLKVAQLTLGYNPYGFQCKVTEINIDWANSSWNAAANTLHCSLSATELNRIFGLLPTVTPSAGHTFKIKGNPGTAACDASIATAKGWVIDKLN